MTPQLVDHAHTDSCIVIGCTLVQPRTKNEHVYFHSCITVAVTTVDTKSHDVAWLSQSQSRHSQTTVIIVNRALRTCNSFGDGSFSISGPGVDNAVPSYPRHIMDYSTDICKNR